MSEIWRKANVSPVFKKCKKEDPGSYRTVRLTSVTGKMMGHLILEAVSLHMDAKKVMRSIHHGFTNGKLC